MARKEIIYRTFDELLASVLSDFKTFDLEGLIDPQDLIKVAQTINKELSAKILRNKQALLEINHGRVKLPNDLYMLNFAFCIEQIETTQPNIQGIQTEERILPKDCYPALNKNCEISCEKELPISCDNTIRITECGESYQLVQTIGSFTKTYKFFDKLYIQDHSLIAQDFKKFFVNAPSPIEKKVRTGYIQNNWLYTNVDKADLYINYEVNMEDEEGNLLVLDHEIVNNYYEYALKTRILENMLVNGEQVAELYKLMDKKRRDARLEARNVVFTPDFEDLKQNWITNRRVMYNRYYTLFLDNRY